MSEEFDEATVRWVTENGNFRLLEEDRRTMSLHFFPPQPYDDFYVEMDFGKLLDEMIACQPDEPYVSFVRHMRPAYEAWLARKNTLETPRPTDRPTDDPEAT